MPYPLFLVGPGADESLGQGGDLFQRQPPITAKQGGRGCQHGVMVTVGQRKKIHSLSPGFAGHFFFRKAAMEPEEEVEPGLGT